MKNDPLEMLRLFQADLIHIRRDLHANPELAFEETRTSQIVADKLGIHPNDIDYIQGDTDKVVFGEGTGGSRSATMSGSLRSSSLRSNWPNRWW